MSAGTAIRVLLVDDSPFVRRAFSRVLGADAGVQVVGEAGDGQQALALCRQLAPDVVLLDLGLPVLDGIEVLRALGREMPRVAVVVVSASTQRGAEATFAALEQGAFDFVDKSQVSPMQLHDLGEVLLDKIRAAAASRRRGPADAPLRQAGAFATPEVLVMGASTGGPPALLHVLARLPADFPAPVVVVQHIPDSFIEALAERIGQSSALAVRTVRARERLQPGHVYFPSGGLDAEVVRRDGQLLLHRRGPAPGSPHVPSVDALFHSAARTCGARAWGVLLTGMGRDGAEGLLAIRRAGGLTVAQDETTSAVYGMPRAARALGAAFAVLPLHEVAALLVEAAGQGSPQAAAPTTRGA